MPGGGGEGSRRKGGRKGEGGREEGREMATWVGEGRGEEEREVGRQQREGGPTSRGREEGGSQNLDHVGAKPISQQHKKEGQNSDCAEGSAT
ncbi:hypothetical protein TIFTF001_036734 [Ficus carica]|uniref:Uncharacterized protein n=1 Tax=Ficus carica TaxID=3494 RepID=A0AA88E4A0_FICCA|nr:hypothetical protein TIFTF001_036734 [Ficus carica]